MRRILVIVGLLLAMSYVLMSEPLKTDLNRNEPHEISFWGIYDLPEVYAPVIEAFEKEHPGVTVSYKQFPDPQEYHDLLINQLQQQKGPDIFLFPDQLKEEYRNLLNPSRAGLSEGFAQVAQQDLVEGKLVYGLPLWIDTLVLYYNKQYYPDGIQPQWYDFAEQTRGINTGGIAMGRLDNMRYGWDILKALFLEKEVTLAGPAQEALFDTLEFFNRFAYPIDRYYNWNEKLSRDYPDLEVDSFAREKVAAIAGYSSLYHFIQTKSGQLDEIGFRHITPEEIGVATFPQFDPKNPKYLAKYFAIGVSIYSDAPNEAWDFIELLTSPEYASYYQQATGRTPGRILEISAEDNELIRAQKRQLPHTGLMRISEADKALLEPIMERGLKDKRLLREVMELSF